MKPALFLFVMLLVFAQWTRGVQPDGTRVIVMGIAQDGGIPHIGCSQKICRTQHHYVSSLAIQDGDSVYLIDATPDLRGQYSELIKRHAGLAKKNLFDGIFLTHAHMGHYTGLMYLGKESVSTNKVSVYCSLEMSAFLKQNAPWSLLVSNSNIELHSIPPEGEVKLGNVSVTPFSVPHRKEFTDTYGYVIRGKTKSLLFIPDIDSWEPVRDSLIRWLQNNDLALLDGTFYSGAELPGRDMRLVPHPTIQNSIGFFQSLPKFKAAIYFTHLNHTNPLLDPDTPETKAFAATPFKIATDWQEFIL